MASIITDYKMIKPPPHLADYIRFFWFTEGVASTDAPFVHNAFAYPCPEFIFCYTGQFKYNVERGPEKTLTPGIYGQTQTFSKVSSSTKFGIFGFYLYPHAFPQLFCIPANELTDQTADIKAVCGKAGEILEEEIMSARNNNDRVKLVCDFLTSRLKNASTAYTPLLSSIKLMSTRNNLAPVKAFAENSYLSLRQFERKFKEFSGFSPKLFLRITRFNSLLNTAFSDKPLVEIAYEHGYYDQSHFIHDFQRFSGYNPKEYFKRDTIAASDRGTVEL
jgi:AraC-like DNA-binding protein